MTLFARLRSPLYHNTGSVARDHLASERTFLAWLRTGLGFIALGIAIERFSQLDLTELLRPPPPPSYPHQPVPPSSSSHASEHTSSGSGSGAAWNGHEQRRKRSNAFKDSSNVLVGALLGTGAGSIAYGSTRYFENMRLLERGLFRPAYYGAGALSIAVAGLAGGVYWSAVKDKRARQAEEEDWVEGR